MACRYLESLAVGGDPRQEIRDRRSATEIRDRDPRQEIRDKRSATEIRDRDPRQRSAIDEITSKSAVTDFESYRVRLTSPIRHLVV